MMKNILFLLAVLMSNAMWAQVTIVLDDMVVAGQSFEIVQSEGLDLGDPGMSSGEAVVWDYSNLASLATQEDAYVALSQVPFTYQFIFNNPNSQSYSNHALPAADLGDELPLPVSDIYNFFRADSEGYFDCGFAASLGGFPLFGARNPTDRIFKLPLEYGMPADTNESFFNLIIPELANIKSFQVRENTLDAWGTVTTPGGTFEALRVRSVVNGVDTIVAPEFEIDQVIERPETIEYRWLSPEQGVPVLQINTVDGMVTQVSYRGQEIIDTSVPELNKMQKLSLFPNPANHIVHLEIPAEAVVESIVLMDVSGRQFSPSYSMSSPLIQVDLTNLTPGMYRIMARTNSGYFTAGLIVQP